RLFAPDVDERIDRLRRFFPTPEQIRSSRWLRWLGPRLHERELWQVRRRSVARGVAIGLFFAFLLPVGQIPVAVLVALAARANVWASAAATLVSNAFTFAPIIFVAFRLGAWLLGAPEGAVPDGGVVAELDPSLEPLGVSGWVAFWWDR